MRTRARRAPRCAGLVAAVAATLVVSACGGGRHHSDAALAQQSAARHIRRRPTPPPPPPQLPRGGRIVLPGHLVVAYYGIPGTGNVLGRTGDPEVDAAGVQHQAAQYARFRLPVLPAFELVTTVASPVPGPDGTYSAPIEWSTVQRYLATARRHRLLLILDFQPGRGQFLDEVKRYQSLLLDPAVGVGLDPEWKLSPAEVPDEVIGASSAAGINAVSSYLSSLVAKHRLPQKLFIIHQFKLFELPDRQNIAFRPGLATVLQMDGFGAIGDKLQSYRAVTANAGRFHIGFKAFFPPTDPVLLSPVQIMALRPRPEYISYQ